MGVSRGPATRSLRSSVKSAAGLFGAVLLVLLVALPTTVGAVNADLSPILAPRAAAPTLPGAPFFPSSAREAVVIERLTVLTQLDETRTAQTALTERATAGALGFGGEGRILASAAALNAAALNDTTLNDTAPNDTAGTDVPKSTARILESQIAALERRAEEIDELAEPLLAETQPYNMGFAAFPVAELRKPFFNDWGRPRSGGRRHKGNDMLAQIGVPLRAIEDGYVERTSNGSLGGLSIYLIGDSGSRYYYAHLDEIGDVVEGQRVYAGQIVGANGDSGNARGAPHLHMQWSPTGESNWENPFFLLDTLFGEGAAAEALEAVDEVPSIDRTDDPFFLDG